MKYTITLFLFCSLLYAQNRIHYSYTLENHAYSKRTLQKLISMSDTVIDVEQLIKRLDDHPVIKLTTITLDTISTDSINVIIDFDTSSTYDISKIGGALKNKKFNEPTDFPRILLEAEFTKYNLRGGLSSISAAVGGWSDRFFSLRWRTPIKPNWNFLILSEVGTYPSETDPWDLTFYNRNRAIIEFLPTTFGSIELELQPSTYSYEDIHTKELDKYSELVTILTYTYDKRDDHLNPRKGPYFHSSLKTNAMYPYKVDDKKFDNLELDWRATYFIPFFNGKHTIGSSIYQNSTIKGERVPYERHYLGGTSNIRGFETGAFGHNLHYENIITSTTEYRFSIYRIPSIKLPFLKWYDKNFKDFPVDIDGGIFINGGYLWPKLSEILDFKNSYSALAAGCGIRIILPTIHIAGAIDVAIPLYSTIEVKKTPQLHIYVDLPL